MVAGADFRHFFHSFQHWLACVTAASPRRKNRRETLFFLREEAAVTQANIDFYLWLFSKLVLSQAPEIRQNVKSENVSKNSIA